MKAYEFKSQIWNVVETLAYIQVIVQVTVQVIVQVTIQVITS